MHQTVGSIWTVRRPELTFLNVHEFQKTVIIKFHLSFHSPYPYLNLEVHQQFHSLLRLPLRYTFVDIDC